MTRIEHEILTYICTAGSPTWTTVLESHRSSVSIDVVESVLNALIKAHLIEIADFPNKPPLCCLRITDSGRMALLTYNEQANELRQKMSDQQASEKRNRKFQFLNTLFGSLFSFILGLVVEHFVSIVDFISENFSIIENAVSRLFP